jgi:parallel beta-helix repeat protein
MLLEKGQMNVKAVLGIMLMLLLVGTLTLAFNVQSAKSTHRTIIVPDNYGKIKWAIGNASAGDTIFVRAGTYYENVVINKRVSLIGENMKNTIIDGNYTGTVVTVLANNVTITGFTIRNSKHVPPSPLTTYSGIYVYNASDLNISHNTITNNNYGVFGNKSSNNVISRNNITKNVEGVRLGFFSPNNNVSGNNIKNNTYGIDLGYSWVCNIVGNNITKNGDGIELYESPDNNIYENNITNNNGWGVGLYDESGAHIYHNNFVNNTPQVYSDMYPTTTGSFDNGYPSGGNYWSNYNGTDLFSGPHQNETGSDGIGDTPYVIYANNTPWRQDNYPLMKPWIPSDVAVVKVAASKTVVGQGFTVNINVTVTNQGNKIEGLNVTAYANTTVIQTEYILLKSGNSTTLTLTWNTTGVPYGNYTISAKIAITTGETNTANNTNIDDNVFVTMPGDFNGNGKVDSTDFVLFLAAYGTSTRQPAYNSACDLNHDGKVDATDFLIFLANYGKTI